MAPCLGLVRRWCLAKPKQMLYRYLGNPIWQAHRNRYCASYAKDSNVHRALSASCRHVLTKFPSHSNSILYQTSSLCSVRSFNSPRKSTSNDNHHKKDAIEDEDRGLLVRFNHENGYLSWCRNCYLATTAGALIFAQDSTVANAKEVGILIIFLGGLNLINGTFSYLYFLVQLRRQGRMSLSASLIQVSLAMIHILLWLAAMAIYIGIVEEDTQDIETDIIEIFTADPRSKR